MPPHMSDLLNTCERTGKLNVRGEELRAALWPHCTSAGLVEALKAQRSVPTAQRLGALLVLEGQHKLAERLSRWLKCGGLRSKARCRLRLPARHTLMQTSRSGYRPNGTPTHDHAAQLAF